MIRPLVPKTRSDTAYWGFRPYFLVASAVNTGHPVVQNLKEEENLVVARGEGSHSVQIGLVQAARQVTPLRGVVQGVEQSAQTEPHSPVGCQDIGQEGLFVVRRRAPRAAESFM